MRTPKDCWECEYNHNCIAWHYGANGCKYEAEIFRKMIDGGKVNGNRSN